MATKIITTVDETTASPSYLLCEANDRLRKITPKNNLATLLSALTLNEPTEVATGYGYNLDAGGYYEIGGFVIVNARFTASNGMTAGNRPICYFPVPLVHAAMSILDVTTGSSFANAFQAYISTDSGRLYVYNSAAITGTVRFCVTGIYRKSST